ncbi:MAG: hypothetical protein ACFFCW_35045 [Candidatus Hodarchaeota archaeon]
MEKTSTGAPLFVSLFGILAMLAGIAAIAIGGAILVEYDISILPTQDLLTRLDVSSTILGVIFVVAGLLLLISGYGLRTLKFWAWLLFVLAFIATIAAFLYLDTTLLVPGGILVAMAVIFGDLLAENEYFLKPEAEWPGTPDFVELLSYIVIIIGLVALVGGVAMFLEVEALTSRIDPESLERAYRGPIDSPKTLGIALAGIGVVILASGWGLKSTQTWAWILFLLVGIGVMALVFMTFPDITLPGAVLVVVSVILGDLIAEKQYFD